MRAYYLLYTVLKDYVLTVACPAGRPSAYPTFTS